MKGYSFASLVKLVQGMMPITGGNFTGNVTGMDFTVKGAFNAMGRTKSDTEGRPALDVIINADIGATQQAVLRSNNRFNGERLGLIHTVSGWEVWNYTSQKTIFNIKHSGLIDMPDLNVKTHATVNGNLNVVNTATLGGADVGSMKTRGDIRFEGKTAGGRQHIWFRYNNANGTNTNDFVQYKDKLGQDSPFVFQHYTGGGGQLKFFTDGRLESRVFRSVREGTLSWVSEDAPNNFPFYSNGGNIGEGYMGIWALRCTAATGDTRIFDAGMLGRKDGTIYGIIRVRNNVTDTGRHWQFHSANGTFYSPGPIVSGSGDINQSNDNGAMYCRDLYIRSDRRVKFNERDFDSGRIIDAIPAQEYDQLIDRDEDGNEKYVVGWGVYAQDVLKHMPSAVSRDTQENGLGLLALRVNYNALSGVLWKEARESRKREAALEERVQKLEEALWQLVGRGSDRPE